MFPCFFLKIPYPFPMPRQVRIEYPGAIYHCMARGDRREAIVLDDEDRDRFRKLLGELCRPKTTARPRHFVW